VEPLHTLVEMVIGGIGGCLPGLALFGIMKPNKLFPQKTVKVFLSCCFAASYLIPKGFFSV
jgi:hypothetical protein